LAALWKDSVQNGFLAYAYYTGEVAKLENREKSLTFAAQLFLNTLRGSGKSSIKKLDGQSKPRSFERAETLNSANDSTKIGLGATYIVGIPVIPRM